VDLVTRRFLITGKVQGVYFRHGTRVEAERLGLGGVARNLPDGSVEVIAHGPRAAVDSLLEWLHHGPARARVEAVRELDVAEACGGRQGGRAAPHVERVQDAAGAPEIPLRFSVE
jgi:acylphosphatase